MFLTLKVVRAGHPGHMPVVPNACPSPRAHACTRTNACHPERSEGSASALHQQIPRCARDDNAGALASLLLVTPVVQRHAKCDADGDTHADELGRASSRERVCPYG